MQCQHCGRDINHPVMVRDNSGSAMRVGSGCARHFQRTTDTERVREYMRSGVTSGATTGSAVNNEASAINSIRKLHDYPATATGKTIGAT